jgi:hypothetical protein
MRKKYERKKKDPERIRARDDLDIIQENALHLAEENESFLRK